MLSDEKRYTIMNGHYIKSKPLSYFDPPFDGLKMMHYLLQKNNYELILRIAEYRHLDEIDTEDLLIQYWKPKYYIPKVKEDDEES